MTRTSHTLSSFFFLLLAIVSTSAQQSQPIQMASLRPGPELRWQRVSPTAQQPDGPVLYQLLLTPGTPGALARFDTNPRHLVSSLLRDNGSSVAIRGLSISDVGIVSFADGQTFPASGLPGLKGEVTGPLGGTVVSNAVSDSTANAIVRRDGSGSFYAGSVALGGVLALPNTASPSVGVLTLGGTPFLHNYGTSNTFVGSSAGNLSMTGGYNSGFGSGALLNNTTGDSNAAFGIVALSSNTTGTGNAAFGPSSLLLNTTGSFNAAFGSGALESNTTGANNAAFGAASLLLNTTGGNNAAFGTDALFSNTTGAKNAAFGDSALFSNSTGENNAAFGYQALTSNTTGLNNAAFGHGALLANTTGAGNAAFGLSALNANTTGAANVAFGANALKSNTTGGGNAALGPNALFSNTAGSENAAFGDSALGQNKTGFANAAFGPVALQNLVSGNGNIAIGGAAGANFTGSESNNIDIGNAGTAGESGVIRIGRNTAYTAAFMAGISGSTSASGVNVFVNTDGQLGTTTSSRRFKQQIADLGPESDILMKLRPVAFYYKPELDSTHTRQYGLVAEEVAQIAPDLVVFDQDGQPQTVRYHFVNAMLLNEVQKQRRQIEAQQQENHTRQQQMQAIEEQMETLARQNSVLQQQLKAVLLRLATVEKSGRQSNTQEGWLGFAPEH